jgi:D-alanyl-D-alanine carboxypeptidase
MRIRYDFSRHVRTSLHGLASTCVLAASLMTSGQVAAGPALLIDVADGRVLYAEDQDHQWHPASVTKIMTAYLTFEAIKAGKLTLETRIPASEVATAQAPSKVGLPVGATMTVDLALKATIIKSANDCSVMLAEAVGGSVEGFSAMMNATAKRLGMTRSNFVNPNGLPASEQLVTARDLAKLSRAVIRDFPEYANLWMMTEMRIGKRRLSSHNGLLRTFDGADGLKTGFTCDSGYNVVATATRDGRRLMAVVLGESSGGERSVRARELLEQGFSKSGVWKAAIDANTTVDTLSMATDAQAAASVRNTVMSRECGGRTRARVATAQKIKAKAALVKAEKTGTAVPEQAAAAAEGDSAPKKPKAKKPN